MQIRPATVQDVAAIELLRLRTWQRAYRGLVPAAFLDALRVTDEQLTRWADRLSDPATTAWVADDGGIGADGGGLVGMAVTGHCRDEDLAGRRELHALYVDADRWRSGTGSALLAAADARVPVEVLWVLKGNARARAFYARHGFTADGASQELTIGGPVVEVRYRR